MKFLLGLRSGLLLLVVLLAFTLLLLLVALDYHQVLGASAFFAMEASDG